MSAKAFLIISLLVISALALFPRGTAASQVAVPSGILEYVPIMISNSQALPTPAPFQQMVTVTSSAYSSYEAPNLQNVEFFNADGSIIPSWLESGNSNIATNTVYWLKLANGIQASSSVTVYMGFASPSTNIFNTQTTGEEAQLSPSYGQYDDGATVFPILYQNFAGTSIPVGWSKSGNTIIINNGAIVPAGSEPDDYLRTNLGYGLSSTQILDMYSNMQSTPGDDGGVDFGFYSGAGNGGIHWRVDSQAAGFRNVDQTDTTTGTLYASNAAHEFSIYWSSAANNVFSYDYGTTQALSGSQATPLPVGIHAVAGSHLASQNEMYWIRIRSYPPNGVMPSASVDTLVVANFTSVTCSPSPVALGSSSVCTATVTGNSPTGTVTWASSGDGTFSPSSCTLSSGACSVAYTPSTSASPVTITASYGGDSNNTPNSGIFSLSVAQAVTTTSVTCSPSPVAVGSPTTCTATIAGVSPTGTVTWASSGVANFSPAPTCTLSAGSCAVSYTPSSSTSPITITATYVSDQNNAGSSGTFSLAVTTSGTSSTVPEFPIASLAVIALVALSIGAVLSKKNVIRKRN